MDNDELPPLLRIPLEIRIIIYRLLLIDQTTELDEPRNLASIPQYHHYERDPSYDETVCSTARILGIRHVNPLLFSETAHKNNKRRATFKIREGRFRAQCVPTTYHCVNRPDIDTGILSVNRQIHEEAARVLYTGYVFDFDVHIETCIPFLSDLTPYSRSFIRRVSFIKRALPYEKDFDRCEWTNMCRYLAQNLSLTSLSLGIVSGKPIFGWEDVVPFPESAFDSIVQTHKRDEMTWVRDLILIKDLKALDIYPCIEHCPPPTSNSMAFFVTFSASVTSTFTDYLTSQMLPVAHTA